MPSFSFEHKSKSKFAFDWRGSAFEQIQLTTFLLFSLQKQKVFVDFNSTHKNMTPGQSNRHTHTKHKIKSEQIKQ